MAQRIGLIGGMSPESTVVYYQHIVREYLRRFGDHNYPEILIYSVQFQRYIDALHASAWDLIAEELIDIARILAGAGAAVLAVATNTMHIVIDRLTRAAVRPVISILDAVAEAAERRSIARIGLLGTNMTMTHNPYQSVFAAKGVEVVVPQPEDRMLVNKIIFDELIVGIINDDSRNRMRDVIARLHDVGCDGVILGCTELPMLVTDGDCDIPLLDSTRIHADAILEAALE